MPGPAEGAALTDPQATFPPGAWRRDEAARSVLERLSPRLVTLRRDLHAHPELSWHEHRTTKVVVDELVGAGLRPLVLPSGTGLICDIPSSGGTDGSPMAHRPRVALRADLDALPLQDEKDVPYRSTSPGVAHACGHDVHTVIVLGAGLALTELARHGDLTEPVRLIFQPAEETLPGGALTVIEAGFVDGLEQIFALHCDPTLEAGHFGVRVGPVTAATDSVTVTLTGPGGHSSRPI